MAVNRGKSFEGVVEKALMEVADTTVIRLYDPQGGYASVSNICDYIVYKYPRMILLECKSIHVNTLSIHGNDPKRKYGMISNRQWEGMLEAKRTSPEIVAGVLCWWIDADITRFIPIEVLNEYYIKGIKSIRYDTADDRIINIEGTKKRVYFDYDMKKFLKMC